MNVIKKALVFFSLSVCLFSFSSITQAQIYTDWYIKSFDTVIKVNTDSSLLITEYITADAGNLPDKHGIFRVLPTQISTNTGIFKTPIDLISITDFNDTPYGYATSNDTFSKTIIWKIGEEDKIVTGENNYKIIYTVKNAVRSNQTVDELYWNLSGNFWEIPINTFQATIIFPTAITEQNTEISYYAGNLGSKESDLAQYNWSNENTLNFNATRVIKPGQGVTTSVTFPKGIVNPYQATFFEKYSSLLYGMLPIITFMLFFYLWFKYGKDPKVKYPIPPEFGIPDNITPMQLGLVANNGNWNNRFISATIVDLAVKQYITIEEVEYKILFITFKDYKITKAENYNTIEHLGKPERLLLALLLDGQESVKLSEIKTTFAQKVPDIQKSAEDDIFSRKWMTRQGKYTRITLVALSMIIFAVGFIFFLSLPIVGFLCIELSAVIILVFGILMPKRTKKGTDLLFRIKGFERYMRQAEDYRQQFYEKENIFDKFLPYAISFDMVKLWAKKMETLYGKKFYDGYHPAWFVGTSHTNFNADNFSTQINGIVTGISTNTGTDSGAAGSGGAGGGGGGGGGGGW